MKTVLPSVAALVAFESAARHGSFTRAAAELHLTQGAISRQIRQLESQLGTALFKRVRQRVTLSDAGRAYLADVRQMLDALELATQRAMAYADGADVLKLAVPPTFSATWLARRLPTFVAAHPSVTINCAMRLPWFDYGTETFDAAIYSGRPTLPGLVVQPLIETEVMPVCSPPFRAAYRIQAATDLTRVPLLHQTNQPMAWADWFSAAGVTAPSGFPGPRFEHIAMLSRAALAGLGVALIPACLIEDELSLGHLQALLPSCARSRLVFYLAIPEGRRTRPAIRAFADWILDAARSKPLARPRLVRGRRSAG
jgi:LysR family glycine cleavage system transcriptional activator